MSVYLDRFLNVPATRLPTAASRRRPGRAARRSYRDLLDRQQQVDEAGQLVASYLGAGGDPAGSSPRSALRSLREDRNFHTIQCVEAAVRQHELLAGTDEAGLPLIAAARYLAAHAPRPRVAAPDVRDRAPPPPRREALRGRGGPSARGLIGG